MTNGEIDVGRVIGDKYRLVRLLGRGSMGEVWAAHHQTLGEHVALKLMTHASPDEEAAESPAVATARFRFEAQVAARLSRKTRHIVRVTDHGEQDGLAYLVMELLDGETLEAVLARQGRIDLPTLANIVRQIARALSQAHGEGVFHRDLKPANVFLTRDEDGQLVAKLLDFGIARAIHAHRAPGSFSTAKGVVFGTPSYMSPEQARGSLKLDHRCDLWALATIAYEAATAELPIEGDDVDAILKDLCAGKLVPIGARMPELDGKLGPFFQRAFAENVDQRFQTATELSAAFARAVDVPADREVSQPSLPEVSSEVGDRPTRLPGVLRPRVALVAVGAVVVLGAIGAVWHALAAPPASLAPPAPATATTRAAPFAAIPPPPPSVSGVAPSVPVSALPHAPVAPARPVVTPPSPVVTPPPPVIAAPATTSAPPTPAPAPTKKDKSDVF
jgi:serine/threonine-protein kinase